MSFSAWTASWFENAAGAADPIAAAYDGQRGSRPHQWFGSCYRAGFACGGLLLLDHARRGLRDVLTTPPYPPALDLDSAWELYRSAPGWIVPLIDELAQEGIGMAPAPSLLGRQPWNPGFHEWSRTVFPDSTRSGKPFAEPGSYVYESFRSCWTAGYFAGVEALSERLLDGFLDLARQHDLPPAVLTFIEESYRDQLDDRIALAAQGGDLGSVLEREPASPIPAADPPVFAPDPRLADFSPEDPLENYLDENDPWNPRTP